MDSLTEHFASFDLLMVSLLFVLVCAILLSFFGIKTK